MTAQKLIIFAIPLLFLNTLYSQTTLSDVIYYDSDEFTLDASDKQALNAIVSNIDTYSDYELKIVGHTDLDGSDAYNINLAKKRAAEVSKFLTQQGLNEAQVTTDWKGEAAPMEAGLSSDAKQKNRRVEINYAVYNFENTSDIISSAHDVTLQHYVSEPGEAITLELDHGTSLVVPSDCFEFEDGSGVPTGEITYEIKETFSFADFIAEDLFTTSKNEILETGGMLYISASADGKPLSIKEGQAIEINYPEQRTKEGMELFYADESEDGIDWTPAGESFAVNQVMPENFQDVDIDFTPLINYKIDPVERPSMTFSPFPAKPKIMRKPFPPSKQVYEYDDKKYKKLYDNYLVNLEKHANRLPIYEAELEKWNSKVDGRLAEVYRYKIAFRKFHAFAKTKGTIKAVQNMIGKKTNLEIITAFEAMLSNTLDLTIDDKKIYKAAFGEQTRVILRERNIFPDVSDYRHFKNDLAHHLRAAVRKEKIKSVEESFAKNGTVNRKDFGSYVGSIKTLGWINCDRFRKYPENMLANINIDETDGDARYYLIFKDIKSMLRPQYSADTKTFAFKRVPKKEDVKIVAIKLVGNKPHIAVKDYVISDNNKLDLNFAPGTLSEIRSQLSSLDNYSGD